MGVGEENLQVIDVHVILEYCPITLVILNILVCVCVCVCVCVFSSHPFWTSSSLDVPAGVTQEEGHTGFLIHLPSAVYNSGYVFFIFLYIKKPLPRS